jgi:hypothetical protein
MNIENLTQDEIKTLHTLFGKLLEEPKQKIYMDPVNQMVDEIMDEFNFAQVFRAMDALEWKWATVNGGKGTPSIDHLRETAERLLRSAAESRLDRFKDEHWELGIINATGGFQATAYCDKDKTKITSLNLQFVVTEWNVDLDDLNRQ